jgi:hypothetical protein
MVLGIPGHTSYRQMLHSRNRAPVVPNEDGPHPIGKQQCRATLRPEFLALLTVPPCPVSSAKNIG